MSDLGVKKLAEVAAFIQLSEDILERAGNGFAGAAPTVHAGLMQVKAVEVRHIVPADKLDIFDIKASKTVGKLTKMMELYVGESWDNPTEVLEWSSFYAGAAAAHCAIAGTLTTGEGGQDAALLNSLQGQFRNLLDEVISQLAAQA